MVTLRTSVSAWRDLRYTAGNKNLPECELATLKAWVVKMSGKEKFYDGGVSTSAAEKRVEQLKAWESSVTNKQPSTVLPSRQVPTVKFRESVIFLAAAHSGDTGEVERLVRKEGADVNFVNKDGLTALHQVSLKLLC